MKKIIYLLLFVFGFSFTGCVGSYYTYDEPVRVVIIQPEYFRITYYRPGYHQKHHHEKIHHGYYHHNNGHKHKK